MNWNRWMYCPANRKKPNRKWWNWLDRSVCVPLKKQRRKRNNRISNVSNGPSNGPVVSNNRVAVNRADSKTADNNVVADSKEADNRVDSKTAVNKEAADNRAAVSMVVANKAGNKTADSKEAADNKDRVTVTSNVPITLTATRADRAISKDRITRMQGEINNLDNKFWLILKSIQTR